MTVYRRPYGTDTWHWCNNCSNFPVMQYEQIVLPDDQRPNTGELDNECLTKECAGKCRM